MEKENSEILAFEIKYTRQERSKDSNGSSKEYTLKKDKLSYEAKNWGFKALKNPKLKKKKLSDKGLTEIHNFLKNNKLLHNYSKVIKTDKRFSFSTFKYEARIETPIEIYELSVVSNDLSAKDKTFTNFGKLFYYLEKSM